MGAHLRVDDARFVPGQAIAGSLASLLPLGRRSRNGLN